MARTIGELTANLEGYYCDRNGEGKSCELLSPAYIIDQNTGVAYLYNGGADFATMCPAYKADGTLLTKKDLEDMLEKEEVLER